MARGKKKQKRVRCCFHSFREQYGIVGWRTKYPWTKWPWTKRTRTKRSQVQSQREWFQVIFRHSSFNKVLLWSSIKYIQCSYNATFVETIKKEAQYRRDDVGKTHTQGRHLSRVCFSSTLYRLFCTLFHYADQPTSPTIYFTAWYNSFWSPARSFKLMRYSYILWT